MSAEHLSESSLKSQLDSVCQDLWWSSESDYPVEVVWCAIPKDEQSKDEKQPPTLLHQIIDVDSDQSLRVEGDIEGFFAKQTTPKSWHTAEDKAQLSQLQQLKTLLSASLTQLQVYRYGEVEVLIYILGRTLDGDIAGVKTCSVET